MNGAFIDTSALYALFLEADSKHRDAVAILRELNRERESLVTTDLVLFESYILVHARTGRTGLLAFRDVIRRSAWLQRVVTRSEHESAAWELLEQRPDKDYSFVDAASFVVMRALGVERAFAFDAHFAQEGFEVLEPKSKTR
jgi:predicted nucleic acid-binding protein